MLRLSWRNKCLRHLTRAPEEDNRQLKQPRRRRQRKRHQKCDFVPFQNSLLIFCLLQFVKCWRIFLELNSWRPYHSSEKEKGNCRFVITSSRKPSDDGKKRKNACCMCRIVVLFRPTGHFLVSKNSLSFKTRLSVNLSCENKLRTSPRFEIEAWCNSEMAYCFPSTNQSTNQPIRSTIQSWMVTRHQYGISELIPQKSFRGKPVVM